ncbi:helix-turn-helix domain-containing protein [Tunicatimonas pelagia]|uniref:helix-turn-helix domain-containing protein n=1 Tax=Tunicatimonas pelagia TaxID=931531 RepID=UPI0026656BC6|nr:helix-turn-helix domain-containing protein [Tunicatimonas pelagia]WKN44941.1 helix-turn-helix domain-containing protein [Tunicatimonas pelagia]
MEKTETFGGSTISFVTHSLDVEIHRHASLQWVYAQDQPFNSRIDSTFYQNIVGFVIRPQVAHRCTSVVGAFTIINAEPHSRVGQYLLQSLAERPVRVFRERRHLLEWMGLLDSKSSVIGVELLLAQMAQRTVINIMDERVLAALQIVQTSPDWSMLSTATLADSVALSSSRLSALFKEQVGSSLSQFLLWNRLKAALRLLLEDDTKTITEIALETGFYDASNFNKYMQQMIGVPPRVFRKNSKLIQVW